MAGLEDLSSGLIEEALGEMAESFFGSRKRLDDLIETFINYASELRKVQEEVVRVGGELMSLLPGEDGISTFWEALGIDARKSLVSGTVPLVEVSGSQLPHLEKIPWGLTLGSRYAKIVLHQYDIYQKAVDAYMNGVATKHPEQNKRMVMSLHRAQLLTLAERINQCIEKMNSEMPASCIIRYASGVVDPSLEGKERIMGAYCPCPDVAMGKSKLDEYYAYHFIDFESYGLVAFVDLPKVSEVKSIIRQFCTELVRTDKVNIVKTMAALKRLM